MALRFIKLELWPFEVFYIAGIEIFYHFCSCERDPYSMEIYRMCKNELRTSRLSKAIVLQTANVWILLHVVTSGYVTKMAVTPFNLP